MKVLCFLIAVLVGTVAKAETVRMAVTTSFHNSGLADVLLPEIEASTGITVQLLVVGTGQALRLGQAGDVDAVLVHSEAAELAFVNNGHATHRRELMYNDFIIVGPKGDPAELATRTSAMGAFAAIAQTRSIFISRGDDSGTHNIEVSLWANSPPQGSWYREVGAGMGAALNTAAAMGAYTLSDRASWLNFGNKGDLALLYSGDPALFNQYSFLPVNPVQHPHVKSEAIARLEAWLVSDAAKSLIDNYQVQGQALFVFNAKQQ